MQFIIVHASISSEQNPPSAWSQKINLALRRTADQLLRLSGDSTSRIPAVNQAGNYIWQVILEQPFSYDQLPAILQASFDIHGITEAYDVTIKRCDNNVIDLGYNYKDFTKKTGVACQGRTMPEGCHYIEVSFIQSKIANKSVTSSGTMVIILSAIIALIWVYRKQKINSGPVDSAEAEWIELGNSRLNVTNQILVCNNISQSLTFREAKLMMLFATHPNQVLERDYIINQVWADEGVLVGRSVDVFVSRLRKKLTEDPKVTLTVAHGVGYRLEIK